MLAFAAADTKVTSYRDIFFEAFDYSELGLVNILRPVSLYCLQKGG